MKCCGPTIAEVHPTRTLDVCKTLPLTLSQAIPLRRLLTIRSKCIQIVSYGTHIADCSNRVRVCFPHISFLVITRNKSVSVIWATSGNIQSITNCLCTVMWYSCRSTSFPWHSQWLPDFMFKIKVVNTLSRRNSNKELKRKLKIT